MGSRKVVSTILALALSALGLVSPASAQSGLDAAVPAPDGSTTVTVPVFGTAMVVTIVISQAGEFVSADIAPSSPAAPVAASAQVVNGSDTGSAPAGALGVFDIKFESGAAKVEVTITIDNGSNSSDPASGDATVTPGDSQWVGDPLGNGDIVVVGYTIGLDAAGVPTIEINSINGAAPAEAAVVASAGELTWYQILTPTISGSRLVQFITFFDAPADPTTQVSTNLTFDITNTGGQNDVSVSLTDPNAASTIDGTATPRGESEGREDDEREGERDD